MVKNLPANTGDMGSIPGSPGVEDPLEEETATHSSILVWEIHDRGNWSMGSQRVGRN